MMKHGIVLLTGLFLMIMASAQRLQPLTGRRQVSLRGLSVVDDRVIWASGSNGMVARSLDSGKTWKWIAVKGFEKRDFRDIEAFDAATAVIMAIGTPGQILKTVNGGESWDLVYENRSAGIFLDALEFWNEQSGIVLGDPIEGKFFIARTFDEGSTWREIPRNRLPAADTGEACFAASGTVLRRLDRDEACFVSGGKRSRFFSKGAPVDLPVVQGRESTGAFSLAVRDDSRLKGSNYFVVVGGDYAADTVSAGNCFVSKDGGKSWTAPASRPHGFRSCVEFLTKTKLLSCGTSGVDISTDGGMNWKLLSTEGFHVCRKAKKGKSVFLAGSGGRIAKLMDF